MQKAFLRQDVDIYKEFINDKIIDYVRQGQIHTFEGFDDFDLMAFEWYDVDKEDKDTSQVLIYFDREDFFVLCEDTRCLKEIEPLVKEDISKEEALYAFFAGLLKNDMDYLEEYENIITKTEENSSRYTNKGYIKKLVGFRHEILRLKRYYEQLDDIIDNLVANENKLLPKKNVQNLIILANRINRFRQFVMDLRDYVTQMREAYQEEIDIEQNNLMRVFTVITAVFLPLTLMVGWYGMNFKYMPELDYAYGYPIFIVISVTICGVLLFIFKKKKWY